MNLQFLLIFKEGCTHKFNNNKNTDTHLFI